MTLTKKKKKRLTSSASDGLRGKMSLTHTAGGRVNGYSRE